MENKKTNYAIGIKVTQAERERAKEKVKDLKRKYGIPRTTVLEMIIIDFLDDEDIINILITKGKLKIKSVNCRKLKKF